MTAPATLTDFESKFSADADPWRTFSARDEAVKRGAVLRGLGGGVRGRVLELGCGNGSNSVGLARRALRLDATDGAGAAVRRARAATADEPRVHVRRLPLPARLPVGAYDAVVVAELLYYLPPRDMRATAREVARALRPGGALVLAHHRVTFHDFAQPAPGIHLRFLAATNRLWRGRTVARNRRWVVEALTRLG